MNVVRMAVPLIAVAVGTGTADASERTAALVNSFQVFCTLETPDFAALDRKATGMRLPVADDKNLGLVHAKTWVVQLKSGPHALLGAQARGPEGEIAGCGIGDNDAAGEEFKQDLVKALKLGAPIRDNTTPDGAQVTSWEYAGDTLLLADGLPPHKTGLLLNLIHKIPTDH